MKVIEEATKEMKYRNRRRKLHQSKLCEKRKARNNGGINGTTILNENENISKAREKK